MQNMIRGGAVIAALVVGVGCSSTAGDGSLAADGVILLVAPDLSGAAPEVVFASVPELLVTADGQVIFAAPAASASDGELLPDVWTQSITPAGLDVVRQALVEGVEPANQPELARLVGAELGSTQFYLPDRYRFRAVEFGSAAEFDDADTPLIPWPDTASIPLSSAGECATLPELEVGELFETAAAESAFVDDGIVYGLVAAQDWKGAPC
jgi:hypothetical protein